MYDLFSGSLRDLTFTSVAVRMILSVLCGGVIGIEREYKRRRAGFRTHILITLGACVAVLTGEFLVVYMHFYSDMSRLGAQVIAGVGFIGAGTIIHTQETRVHGLTTAAGLWTSAVIGLCFGAGFYEGGFITTILILAAELFLSKLEYRIRRNAPRITVYVEYKEADTISDLTRALKDRKIRIDGISISRAEKSSGHGLRLRCAVLSLQLPRNFSPQQALNQIRTLPGIADVEEL